MWTRCADPRCLAALLLVGACGDPADSGAGPLNLAGDGGSLGLEATLVLPIHPAAPDTDVELAWPDLSHDLLGLPASEPDQLRLWAFEGLGVEELSAGLLADDLDAASVLTQYGCTPQGRTCSFSELEVYGHDFDVRDDFGVLDATWLLSLHGEGRRGVQALAVLEPGKEETVSIEDGSLGLEVTAGEPLEVAAGEIPALDWAGLDTGALGQSIAAYRIDLLGLFRVPEDPDDLPARLASRGLEGADAWWLEVADADGADLGAVRGGEPFEGFQPGSSWLLGLYVSGSISPLPAVLVEVRVR